MTLQLEDISATPHPQYSILSHSHNYTRGQSGLKDLQGCRGHENQQDMTLAVPELYAKYLVWVVDNTVAHRQRRRNWHVLWRHGSTKRST